MKHSAILYSSGKIIDRILLDDIVSIKTVSIQGNSMIEAVCVNSTRSYADEIKFE